MVEKNKTDTLKKELSGKIFHKEKWKQPIDNPNWSHDHCEICNKEISNIKDAINEGYTDKKRFYWICEDCFKKYMKELRIKEND